MMSFRRFVWAWPLIVLAVALVLTLPRLFIQRDLRNDFSVYYYAARVEQQGNNPYDDEQLNQVARSDGNPKYIYPYLYPPLLCQIMRPLVHLTPWQAQQVWLAFNLICLALLMVVLVRLGALATGLKECPRRVSYVIAATGVLTLFFAVRRDLKMGQINIVVTLLIASALYLVERRRAIGGSLLAFAAALKVLPALLVLLLLARGKRRAVVSMAGTSIVVIALALATIGRDVSEYRSMTTKMGYGRSITAKFGPDFFNNFSFGGFFARFLGVGSPLVAPLSTVCIGALLGLGIVFRRDLAHPKSWPQGLTYVTCLMILASPVVWLHHLVYLLPAACAAVAHVMTAPSPVRRRRAGLLLGLMAISSLPFEDVYTALFEDRLPRWTMSILIPNLFLIIALTITAVLTAHSNPLEGS